MCFSSMISGESDSRKCHYPSWFLAHNRWQTLDGRWSYNPHKNTTLRITNIAAHGTVSSSAGPSFSSGGSSSSGVDSRQEQKAVCQSVLDLGDGTARVVAHLSQGWCVSVTFRDTRSSLSLSLSLLAKASAELYRWDRTRKAEREVSLCRENTNRLSIHKQKDSGRMDHFLHGG